LPLLVFSLSATGCGQSDATLARWDGDSEDPEEQHDARSLRIDVFPSDELASQALDADTRLQAQSFRLQGRELQDLGRLGLQAPVILEGLVTGFVSYPSAAEVGVPGIDDVPVEAEIRAYVPGLPMGQTVVSDPDDGSYSLQLTPSTEAYQLAVVPRDPVLLPQWVAADFLVRPDDGGVLDLELDPGVPLYGRVAEGDVSGALEGLAVQAIDLASGVAGPRAVTSSDGSYHLRVTPGQHELVVEGDVGRHLPELRLEADVVGPEAGLRLDVTYVAAAPITVDGGVVDADGRELAGVRVRFTSLYLDDNPDGELVVETTTGSNGRFSNRAVPGDYRVEVIPEYGGEHGPVLWAEVVALTERYTELGGDEGISLESRPVVSATVLDAEGAALADVLVRAVELGFDGYAYSTVTDSRGRFVLPVADGELQWSFTPPAGADGATHFEVATAEELEDSVQLSSGLVVAGCLSFEDVPASYTPLDVRDTADRLYATAMTGADGCFEVRVDWDQVSPDEALDTGE